MQRRASVLNLTDQFSEAENVYKSAIPFVVFRFCHRASLKQRRSISHPTSPKPGRVTFSGQLPNRKLDTPGSRIVDYWGERHADSLGITSRIFRHFLEFVHLLSFGTALP
jgi:hypothetical protein